MERPSPPRHVDRDVDASAQVQVQVQAQANAHAHAQAQPQDQDRGHDQDDEVHAILNCCCGRVDCALLKKNRSILETVEKDVHTAAQLGQVRAASFPPPFTTFDICLALPNAFELN